MARYGRLLTYAQWTKIQPLLPKRPPPERVSFLPLWQVLHSWFTPLVYRAV